MKPAVAQRAYRVRSTIGLGRLIASSMSIGVLTFSNWQLSHPAIVFIVLWSIAGVSMGLIYFDRSIFSLKIQPSQTASHLRRWRARQLTSDLYRVQHSTNLCAINCAWQLIPTAYK